MPDSESPKPVDDEESPRARRASARVARHSATEKRRVEKAAARAYAASKRQSTRHKSAAGSANSLGNNKIAELPVVTEDVPSGGAVLAVEEEQAEAERQVRVRQDAEQAQSEQVGASRIEAERQELERAGAERVAAEAANEPTQPDKARDSVRPGEVIDEPRVLAAPKTKSVATKVSVKTAGELAAEADRREAERREAQRSSFDAPAESTTMRPAGTPKPSKIPKPPRERSANRNRNWRLAAGIVGTAGLVLSVILAAGALLIALGADQGSGFVGSVADLCNFLVGPLSDLFSFDGLNAETKQALVSWGLGSMIYLLVSRFIQSTLLRRAQDR